MSNSSTATRLMMVMGAGAVAFLAMAAVGQSTLPATRPTSEPTTATATTNSVTRPTTQAVGNGKTLLPSAYAIFSRRSLFTNKPLAADTAAAPMPTTMVATPVALPIEQTMVFAGAIDADGVGAALFEDTAAGRVLKFNVGDAIARGRITRITIDAIDYDVAGRTVHVTVGQTLDGAAGPDLRNRAVLLQPTTNPASPGGDDVLERLRAKRRQELGS